MTSNGQGMMNYGHGNPSYAYTTRTTQFDDELIRRDIVTKEQALLAKGMSNETAQRLLRDEQVAKQQQQQQSYQQQQNEDCATNSDDDDSFVDDAFMESYRTKRMAQMQVESQQQQQQQVRTIAREEWKEYVNDASRITWVVVCLLATNSSTTKNVVAIVQQLAKSHASTNFVFIPSVSAIPDWPETNLPALFLYRHGSKQHEMIRLPTSISYTTLERQLQDLSVLE